MGGHGAERYFGTGAFVFSYCSLGGRVHPILVPTHPPHLWALRLKSIQKSQSLPTWLSNFISLRQHGSIVVQRHEAWMRKGGQTRHDGWRPSRRHPDKPDQTQTQPTRRNYLPAGNQGPFCQAHLIWELCSEEGEQVDSPNVQHRPSCPWLCHKLASSGWAGQATWNLGRWERTGRGWRATNN